MGKTVHGPEIVAEIRRLWDKGFAARQIGLLLGMTKNKIIGIIDRNNFPPPPEGRPKAGLLSFSQTGVNPCCYPLWDSSKRRGFSCNAPSIAFKPYCQEHWTLTHVQKPAPEENAHAG